MSEEFSENQNGVTESAELQDINWTQYGLSDRQSLLIDPKNPDEANIYVGREDVLAKIDEKTSAASHKLGAPLRFVFFGDYGSGKTHSLFKAAQLAKEKKIKERSVYEYGNTAGLYVKISAPRSKTFSDIYRDVVNEAIGKNVFLGWIKDFYDKMEIQLELRGTNTAEREEKIERYFFGKLNFNVNELAKLIVRFAPLPSDSIEVNEIWQWMAGYTCKPEVMKKFGINEDNTNPNTAMKNLVGIFELFNTTYEDKILILMFDECEKLANLGEKELVSYDEAFRTMIEYTDVGLFFTETAAGDQAGKLFSRESIKSRLGPNFVPLKTIADVDTTNEDHDARGWIKKYLEAARPDGDGWKQRVKEAIDELGEDFDGGITEELFPFTDKCAKEAISAIGAPASPITPRSILKQCEAVISKQAKDENKKIFTSAGA